MEQQFHLRQIILYVVLKTVFFASMKHIAQNVFLAEQFINKLIRQFVLNLFKIATTI